MSKTTPVYEDPSSSLKFDMSPVKKERMKKLQKQVLRQKLRESLPVLTRQEIRKYRLPYHEALLMDLEESGYIHSPEFIRQLLELQERTRSRFGPGTVVWMRPELKDSKPNLDMLVKCLTTAETAHNAGHMVVEWDNMLQLAAHYAFGTDDWWWLGEQLLYQCVSIEYPGEYSKQRAMAYFIIGKYLVENGKKMDAGRYYLDLARDMSKSKSWSCSKVLGKKQDTVFVESSRLLYKVLAEEALHLMKTDPHRAVEVCNIARKRAAEACEHHNEYEALLLRGRCELLLNNPTDAIATVMKTLHRAVRRGFVKEICEAKIALALAFLQHGKSKECMECLKDLKELAQTNNMLFYVAQAYRFMGEYYLNQKRPSKATGLLMHGFYLFHEIKDLHRREKVRTWAAISAGEELFPAFIKLIQNSDNTEEGREHLMTLIQWIDERKFFWTQESKFSLSYASLQHKLLEKMETAT